MFKVIFLLYVVVASLFTFALLMEYERSTIGIFVVFTLTTLLPSLGFLWLKKNPVSERLASSGGIRALCLEVLVFTCWYTVAFVSQILTMIFIIPLITGGVFLGIILLIGVSAFTFDVHILWVAGVAIVVLVRLVRVYIAPASSALFLQGIVRRLALGICATGIVLVAALSLLMSSQLWTALYGHMARTSGDTTWCTLPSFVGDAEARERWYKNCVPSADYEQSLQDRESCASFDKNDPAYVNCKLKQLHEAIYDANTAIICDDIPSTYTDDCTKLQKIQQAIRTNDASVCDELTPSGKYPDYGSFALCIGNFPTSPQWSNGCALIWAHVKERADMGANRGGSLIVGRCLTTDTADVQLAGFNDGGQDPLMSYGDVYKKHSKELGRTDVYAPYAPAWFLGIGARTEKGFEYFKHIGVDPNATDDFGRTALVVELQDRLYLNSLTVHDISSLPLNQQEVAAKEILKTLRLLIAFGVDPLIQDITGFSAIDYAARFKSDALRHQALEILSPGALDTSRQEIRYESVDGKLSLFYPEALVLRSRSTDTDDGIKWEIFEDRNKNSYYKDSLAVGIGPISVPLDMTNDTPMYDSCLTDRMPALFAYSSSYHNEITPATINGVKAERLRRYYNKSLETEMIIIESNNVCYLVVVAYSDSRSYFKNSKAATRLLDSVTLIP